MSKKNRSNQQPHVFKGNTVTEETNKPDDTQSSSPEQTEGAPVEQSTTGDEAQTQQSQAPAIEDKGVVDASVDPVKTPIAPMEIPVTDKPVVQDTPVQAADPVVQETKAAEPSDFEALMAHVMANGSSGLKTLKHSLDNYVSIMGPRAEMKGDVGSAQQYNFWMAIRKAINQTDNQEFRKQWFLLIAYFKQHKDTAFALHRVFRFSEYWNRSTDELKQFQRILNILYASANPEPNRSVDKEVNLDNSMAEGFSETARQNVIQYYQG